MKEANSKRLYTIGFQVGDIPGKAKLWKQQKDQWLPKAWGGKEGREE